MSRKNREEIDILRQQLHKSVEEIKDSISDMRAMYQQTQAISELNIKNLTEEVREHNNFARRMPVVEEQIKVANHRIEDLERRQEGAH